MYVEERNAPGAGGKSTHTHNRSLRNWTYRY